MIRHLQATDYSFYKDKILSLCGGGFAYVISFGCQQNEADGEVIRGILADIGYTPTESAELADIIIVNTCAIRAHAEDKILSLLGSFKALKRKKPELIIGICGCMSAEAHRVNSLKTDFHYVTFTLEPNRLFELPQIIFGILESRCRIFPIGMDDGNIVEGLPTLRTHKHRAWVSVMYGCNNFCSYCIVPYVRGRERSRASSDILTECRELITSGCKEIMLLGQNVNSYRSDMTFAELISAIADIEGDFIIRFMTSHPKDVSDALISALKEKRNKIAPHFHLPLQSGSSKILKAMNRAYTKERYLEVVSKLRRAVPDIAITTDIIVGFPGETDADFADTLDILTSVKYDLVYAFAYSPRVGTPAEKMQGQVPQEVKTERLTRLLTLQDEISRGRNLPYINTVQRVLTEKRRATENGYIYDGKTAGGKPVHFTSSEDVLHIFADVLIEKATPFDLYGKQI